MKREEREEHPEESTVRLMRAVKDVTMQKQIMIMKNAEMEEEEEEEKRETG